MSDKYNIHSSNINRGLSIAGFVVCFLLVCIISYLMFDSHFYNKYPIVSDKPDRQDKRPDNWKHIYGLGWINETRRYNYWMCGSIFGCLLLVVTIVGFTITSLFYTNNPDILNIDYVNITG